MILPVVNGTRYTEEESQYVRDHYQEMSDKELAEHLGKTEQSIEQHRRYNQLRREGEKSKNPCKDNKKEILLLYRQGKTTTEICEELGINRQTLLMAYKRWGLNAKRAKY